MDPNFYIFIFFAFIQRKKKAKSDPSAPPPAQLVKKSKAPLVFDLAALVPKKVDNSAQAQQKKKMTAAKKTTLEATTGLPCARVYAAISVAFAESHARAHKLGAHTRAPNIHSHKHSFPLSFILSYLYYPPTPSIFPKVPSNSVEKSAKNPRPSARRK